IESRAGVLPDEPPSMLIAHAELSGQLPDRGCGGQPPKSGAHWAVVFAEDSIQPGQQTRGSFTKFVEQVPCARPTEVEHLSRGIGPRLSGIDEDCGVGAQGD